MWGVWLRHRWLPATSASPAPGWCLLHHRTWRASLLCLPITRPTPAKAHWLQQEPSLGANLKKKHQPIKISIGFLWQPRPASLLEELPQGALPRQISHGSAKSSSGFPWPSLNLLYQGLGWCKWEENLAFAICCIFHLQGTLRTLSDELLLRPMREARCYRAIPLEKPKTLSDLLMAKDCWGLSIYESWAPNALSQWQGLSSFSQILQEETALPLLLGPAFRPWFLLECSEPRAPGLNSSWEQALKKSQKPIIVSLKARVCWRDW